MSFTQHLPQEQINTIRRTILNALGYDPATRSALLGGLPVGYRSLLPGGLAAPAIGLQLDLTQLNTTQRLVDAIVPLEVFLDNAIGLAEGHQETAEPRGPSPRRDSQFRRETGRGRARRRHRSHRHPRRHGLPRLHGRRRNREPGRGPTARAPLREAPCHER